jgi:hypothetical protein
MAKAPSFDLAEAHRYFAAQCFNRAWDLIDKKDRTAADDRLMVALNQASIYHWSQRPDFSDRNVSVGYWQASRIQALIGNADEARRHALVSLQYSQALEPFLLGYAHEALARAAAVAGDSAGARENLAVAETLAAKVTDRENRDLLVADLEELKARL